MDRVAILGCGPAGLAAAHAVVSLGYEAVIVSERETKSPIYGCQYLHAPIPGYDNVGHVRVSYRLVGTPEQYRRKVYGDEWQGKVSPEDFVGEHDAWDIRETYARMWQDLIGSMRVQVVTKYIKRGRLDFVSEMHPDLIVSTIPARAICEDSTHEFRSHTIYANGSTSAGVMEESSIVCDGTAGADWYRVSNVFGYRTTEWAHMPRGINAVVPVAKPLWTNCDCHPEVLRVGRYGAWEKKRLVHEVYPTVMEVLK